MTNIQLTEVTTDEYLIKKDNYTKNKTKLYNVLRGTETGIQVQSKKGTKINLSDKIIKKGTSNLVIYTISDDTVIEEHFISDGITMIEGAIQPIINNGLLNPKGNILQKNIIDSIKTSILLNEEYQYKWVNNMIICVDKDNNPKGVDSIDTDDFYTLKLLELIMKKGLHTGVLLLDSKHLTEKVCSDLKTIIKILCKDYIIIHIE